MYSFNAWIELHDAAGEASFEYFDSQIKQLRQLLASVKFKYCPENPILNANGLTILMMSCVHNHENGEHSELLRVLDWVVKHLPLSFGIVYWCNDEMVVDGRRVAAQYDGFWVLVVAKGQVSQRGDPFLSPRIPVREDDEAVK